MENKEKEKSTEEDAEKKNKHDVFSLEAAEQLRPGHTSDEEKRWDSFWEFTCGAICYLLHPHASPSVTLQLYARGGGFAIFFVALSILIGGPMILFEVGLGQSTLAHAVDAFRICPIVQGLGFGMLVCTMMMMVFENVSLGSSGVFAIIALTTPSQKLDKKLVGNQSSAIGQVPDGYSTYEKYVGSIHYMHGEGAGHVHAEMLMCVIFSWVVIILSGLNVAVHYSKSICITVILIFELLLLWLFSTVVEYPGATWGLDEMFNIKTYPDFEMGVVAFMQVLLAMGLGCGELVRMGSLARFRWPQNSSWAYGLAFIVACKEMVFAMLAAAALGAAAEVRNTTIHSLIHMEMIGLELKVLSVALEHASFAHFWGTFLFVCFWCGEVYYVIMLLKWVVSGLKSTIRSLLKSVRNFHVPVTIVWCLLCLGIGIFFCFRNTVGYGVLWELHQPNWAIGALCMTEMIAGVYCFGPKDIMLAFEESMGYYPDWYTRVCWLTLPIFISIAMLVSMNVAYARRTDPDRYTCSRIDCLDGLPGMVTVLVPVAIVALHNIRVFTLKGTIGELVRPQRRRRDVEQRSLDSIHGESLGSDSSSTARYEEASGHSKFDNKSQLDDQRSNIEDTGQKKGFTW